MRSRQVRLRIIVPLVFSTFCAGAVIAFRGAGRWLVRQDPLRAADVIVVLSGSLPARAEEAASIFRMGYAPEVWVTTPENPASELAEMKIRYLGEETYNREVLIYDGVPEAAVRILPETIVDTQQEIEEVAQGMRREGKSRVIIVTSPQHTRRVRTLWHKLAGRELATIVRAAPEDTFNPDHWWRDTQDTFSVVREMMGLLNSWIGLPVRPRSR
jgi:uncharacterized SAM-binding protein YcdF (DUF218 family)